MDRHTMISLYKSRNDPVRNIQKKRIDSNIKIKIQRQDRRTQMFNERRIMSGQEDIENKSENMSTNEKNSPKSSKLNERKLALQKYKFEKEVIKKALNIKKKPPFVVGIPHHGNSPILKEVTAKKKQNSVNQVQDIRHKRVTRANLKSENEILKQDNVFEFKSPVKVFPFTERKSKFMFQHNKVSAMKKLTSPHTPTVLKRSARKIEQSKRPNIDNDIKKVVKKPVLLGKVLKKVLESEKKLSTSSIDSNKSLATPLSDTEVFGDNRSLQGESNVLHCQKQNIPGDQITVKLEIPDKSEDPETALQRERVDKESDHLLSLAEEWESIKNTIPRDIVDEIDSVIGQTRLLTSDKFNQYRRLIDEYESQQGSHKITLEDLNGFWDMMYLQVEHLVKRYDKLEVFKMNNWQEQKPATPAKKRKGPHKRKVITVETTSTANQQLSQSTVKEEVVTMKTPTEGKKPLQVLNLSQTPRRNSPSPYIAMRLSGVGRSLKNPSPSEVETVESTLTPRGVLKPGMNSGSMAKKNVVLNPSPLEGGETIECTPRRSIRLVGRTPVSQIKFCSSCQSPDCSTLIGGGKCKKSVKRRSRWSQKAVSVAAEQELENMPADSSTSTNIQLEKVEKISSKKFLLRPSKLVVNDSSNKSEVPEKTRRTLRSDDKENSSPMVEDVELSKLVRRSTRKASAKKVTFNSSVTEKHNFKLPSTPHVKKGCNQGSFSDSSD